MFVAGLATQAEELGVEILFQVLLHQIFFINEDGSVGRCYHPCEWRFIDAHGKPKDSFMPGME